MKITVVAVGKIKERFFEDAVREYEKRLGRYCKLEIIQVADERTPDGAGEAAVRQIKEREGERLLSHVKDGMYVIALAIDGKMLSSEELSEHLSALALYRESHLAFVIGGSLGLSEDVLKRANEALSFSKMTFPHQLMRVILLEQLYRSFKIQAGEPYHK